MGLVWDRAQSWAFQNQLRANVTAWESAATVWKAQINAAMSRLGTDLQGEAASAFHSLFEVRILPIVDSMQRACAWTKQHLEAYATAEKQLSELSNHLDEDALAYSVFLLDRDLTWYRNWFANFSWTSGDFYLRKLQAVQDTQKELDTLRYFASFVASLFSEELTLCSSIRAGIESIERGTLSGGQFIPGSEEEDESWIQSLNRYISYHAATVNTAAIAAAMKQRLIDAGQLDENPPSDWPENKPWPGELYDNWLTNAAKNNVPIDEIVAIAKDHDITPGSFLVLDGLQYQDDPDHKRFFIIDPKTDPQVAMSIVVMTYIYNAGTGYAVADDTGNPQDQGSTKNDYAETPYSSKEIERIKERQQANSWSYNIIHNTGAVMATPNGMLMGVGGTAIVQKLSQQGGTTYGDILLLNLDETTNPKLTLMSVVHSGSTPNDDLAQTGPTAGVSATTSNWRDLDRLLHHEQLHSQQWQDHGKQDYATEYLLEAGIKYSDERYNTWEQGAGLHDGGYS